MSRMSTNPQRNLSLPEELEKLEQSITLTLQEIDHNFSRAHQVVTQTILPVVEQYGKHSEAVWEGSKFWKQFFEASANVSLNGYEDAPTDADTTTTNTAPTDSTLATDDPDASHATPYSSSYASPPAAHAALDLATPQPSHTPSATATSPSFADSADQTLTPRPARAQRPQRTPPDAANDSTTFATAPYDSPYERLRREVLPHAAESSSAGSPPDDSPSRLPSTPRTHPSRAESLPPASAAPDTLLHTVLDRTYRLRATPHAAPRTGVRHGQGGGGGGTPATGRRAPPRAASGGGGGLDLDSSPLAEAPQLRSALFASPARTARARGANAPRDEAAERDRVPGTSLLTPARAGGSGGGGARSFAAWDDDDDDDDDDEGLPAGMSPPKTMQFHIPQSQLLKTPAREASRRIVEDLLRTAGGTMASEDDGGGGEEEGELDSPSIVGRRRMLEEDTF